jgi:hypothetical protein
MAESDEVMAVVRYEFEHAGWPGVPIKGAVTFRRLSEAQAAVAALNKEYGDGSHWVEPSKFTYSEHLENLRAGATP